MYVQIVVYTFKAETLIHFPILILNPLGLQQLSINFKLLFHSTRISIVLLFFWSMKPICMSYMTLIITHKMESLQANLCTCDTCRVIYDRAESHMIFCAVAQLSWFTDRYLSFQGRIWCHSWQSKIHRGNRWKKWKICFYSCKKILTKLMWWITEHYKMKEIWYNDECVSGTNKYCYETLWMRHLQYHSKTKIPSSPLNLIRCMFTTK